MELRRYKPARLGLGTESSQYLQPIDFSPDIRNRFYNLLGDLEKRPGMSQLGAQITSAFGVVASAQITNLHEHINTSGDSTLFASGIVDNGSNRYGVIWRYVSASAYWQNMFSDSSLAKDPNAKIYSVQANDKLIFCNGKDRNFFLDNNTANVQDVSANNFQPLYSSVIKGIAGGGTTSNLLFDANVTDWINETNVAVNDLLMTQVSSNGVLQGAGVVTSVGTTSLDVTPISANGDGIGRGTLASGVGYRIVDMVELNIIPTPAGGGDITDNVAVGGASTSANAISVTAFNFADSDIRKGDIIYNTTKNAVTQVISVSANVAVVPVSGQASGDSFVFLKDALPIASYPHVHYGRLHLIDARDQTKIRVSGPNDPEDFTTFNKTLSSVTIDYGARQPKGDILLTMDTFQRYLVVGGQQAVYATDGTNPIADTTADVVDLDPVGLFPQGVVSPQGLKSIGNEMYYLAHDGLRSFLAAFDSKNTTTNNKSEQIKTQLATQISTLLTDNQQLQLIHYKKRNWLMLKIGTSMYNYNYTPTYQLGSLQGFGTFTRFTGLLSNQLAFLVRRNDTLITGGADGKIFTFDDNSTTDNGAIITTKYVSPWHTLQEGETDLTLINKDGRYLKPIFETYGEVEYNISVVGDYDILATDSVVVTALGAFVVGSSQVGTATIGNTTITEPKVPLRWRGQQVQYTIETSSESGNDIINSYTIYGNVFGRR